MTNTYQVFVNVAKFYARLSENKRSRVGTIRVVSKKRIVNKLIEKKCPIAFIHKSSSTIYSISTVCLLVEVLSTLLYQTLL